MDHGVPDTAEEPPIPMMLLVPFANSLASQAPAWSIDESSNACFAWMYVFLKIAFFSALGKH